VLHRNHAKKIPQQATIIRVFFFKELLGNHSASQNPPPMDSYRRVAMEHQQSYPISNNRRRKVGENVNTAKIFLCRLCRIDLRQSLKTRRYESNSYYSSVKKLLTN